MPERHRLICERRVAGETLQQVGDAFGVTRERIRQIEVRWRLQGLHIPGANPLNEAAAQKLMAACHLRPDGSPTGRGRPRKETVKDDAYWRAKVDHAFRTAGA
jgi:hypothetical protein